MPVLLPNGTAGVTDVLIGAGNTTASIRGSLAFAVAFFGPLASNSAFLNESFSILNAEEDASAPIKMDAETANMRPVFYRRKFEKSHPLTQAYQPDRNLTMANLPVPEAAHCGSEFVECVPGPCSVWEYDYQFMGLQESQFGRVEDHVMDARRVFNGSSAGVFQDEARGFNSTFFPMVGVPRCGPLFNFQYVNVYNSDGSEYVPEYEAEGPGPISEFDKIHTVLPPSGSLSHETLKFLPVTAGEEHVYPIPGEAMVPVPHGVNFNPKWYYEEYSECFPPPLYEESPARPGCNLEQLLVNWLYDVNPAPLMCSAMTKPPPYAPLGVFPDNMTNFRASAKAWTSLVPTGNVSVPAINETDERLAAAGVYAGNPRLTTAETIDGDLRPVLLGYTRGQEEKTDIRHEVIRTFDGEDSPHFTPMEGPTLRAAHYPNGRGPNHRITPHEIPGDYTPDTCDFTQCRWIPQVGSAMTKKGKRDHALKPWDAMYASFFSEMAQSPVLGTQDALADSGIPPSPSPSTPYSYSYLAAEANRIRAYGVQDITYVAAWVKDDVKELELDNVVLPNGTLGRCMYDCSTYLYCTNSTEAADQTDCAAASSNGLCPLCTDDNLNSGHLPYTNATWVCCADYVQDVILAGTHPSFVGCLAENAYDKKAKDLFNLDDGVTLAQYAYDAAGNVTSRPGCKAFHKRDIQNVVLLTANVHPRELNGRCNMIDVLDDVTPPSPSPSPPLPPLLTGSHSPYSEAVRACYIMLGVSKLNSAGEYVGARQIPLRKDRARPLDLSHNEKNDKYAVPFTRVQAIHFNRKKVPGMPGMTCADDQNAFFYELSNEYTSSVTDDLTIKIDYPGNFVPTRKHLSTFQNTPFPLDDPTQFTGCGTNGVGDGTNCGPYIMVAPNKPTPRARKYTTLEAYYAETRAAYPNPTASRQAAFPNSNKVTDGFACDCKSRTIVWRHLDVPPKPLKALADEAAASAAPSAAGQVFKRLQDGTYKSSIPVIRSLAWSVPQTETTPDVGLFLPSSQPLFFQLERDFLRDRDRVTSGGQLLSTSGVTREIERKYSGQDSPGRDELRNMILSDNVTGTAQQQLDAGVVNRIITFKRGSCLRWPYGQVPRIMFQDDEQRTKHYPEDVRTKAAYDFDLNATIGYCEPIVNMTKFQACANDRLAPQERSAFCAEHNLTAKHVLYAAQLDPALRTLETACSTEHRTCLVIPGPGTLGSLGAMLRHHHVKHRDKPADGANYTFLVTPFNSTVLELFLGPGRVLAPVAQGRDFTEFSHFTALEDAEANVTGIAANETAFLPFDDNVHSVREIQDAASYVLQQLQRFAGPGEAGCLEGEVRVPARSGSPRATECVTNASLTLGSEETGAETHFIGTVIASAVPSEPLRYVATPSHTCERIKINSANTRIESEVEADQSECPNDAAAAVAVTAEEANLTFVKKITIKGPRVAAGLVVTPFPPKTSTITNATFGPITFADAFANPTGLRVDAAFAAAVGSNVSAKGLNLVLLPRLGAGNLTFNLAAMPNSTKDLSSTLAEVGTGVLRKLFPVIPTGGHATLAIFVSLIIVLAALVASAVIEVQKLSRQNRIDPRPKPAPMRAKPNPGVDAGNTAVGETDPLLPLGQTAGSMRSRHRPVVYL